MCSFDAKIVKLLGIHLDSRLSWDIHTNNVIINLSRILFFIRTLKSCTHMCLILYAYFAFFHSNLTYGILFWGNSTGAQQVFLWQKKAIRTIVDIKQCDSCKKYFRELKIMTLPSIFIFYTLLFVKENYYALNLRRNIHNYNLEERT